MESPATSRADTAPLPARRSSVRNRLLRTLGDADFDAIGPCLEPFELTHGFRIAEPRQPTTHVYFPEAAIASVIAVSPGGNRSEAGLLGRDGFTPTGAAVGSESSANLVIAQVPGASHRVRIEDFDEVMRRGVAFRHLLQRFTQTMLTQVAYTALSNAVHPVDVRLARWLLMTHDRVDGDELPLTHEFIAIMLAVRRPSVTTSLHVLEGMGMIRTERGRITIRRRAALEEFAADAYGIPEDEYRRLIGPFR